MSERARKLCLYANELEQLKISLFQWEQHEIARSLEHPVELLRKEAELELIKYEVRYRTDA